MAFGNGVVQGRVAFVVGGVERAPVLEQQRDHGGGADGRGTVDGVLAAAVADACRRRGLVVDEEAGDVEVSLGGDEVEGALARKLLTLPGRS